MRYTAPYFGAIFGTALHCTVEQAAIGGSVTALPIAGWANDPNNHVKLLTVSGMAGG